MASGPLRARSLTQEPGAQASALASLLRHCRDLEDLARACRPW